MRLPRPRAVRLRDLMTADPLVTGVAPLDQATRHLALQVVAEAQILVRAAQIVRIDAGATATLFLVEDHAAGIQKITVIQVGELAGCRRRADRTIKAGAQRFRPQWNPPGWDEPRSRVTSRAEAEALRPSGEPPGSRTDRPRTTWPRQPQALSPRSPRGSRRHAASYRAWCRFPPPCRGRGACAPGRSQTASRK